LLLRNDTARSTKASSTFTTKGPLAALGTHYRLNPVKDLVPVCPNCHAMLHKREPPYDVEELRATLVS